jgi:hypothetical protein
MFYPSILDLIRALACDLFARLLNGGKDHDV